MRRLLIMIGLAAIGLGPTGCVRYLGLMPGQQGTGSDGPQRGDGPGSGNDGRAGDGTVAPGGWVTIQAGSFSMGSPASEDCRDVNNETRHPVTLTHGLEIQKFHVTQAQFAAARGYQPTQFAACATCPQDSVNWHEAAAYCNQLSANTGRAPCYSCSPAGGPSVTCSTDPKYDGAKIYTCPGYRLPTDAEFEYAKRASTTGSTWAGNITNCQVSSTDPVADAIAWYDGNSGWKTHPSGQKAKNQWGLYDLAGNAWEWCQDWFTNDLGTAAVTDPIGPATGTARVMRGGAWSSFPHLLRAAYRGSNPPANRDKDSGFRCVRSL